MFVSINTDGEWYGIEMHCLRKENWWVIRGGECDGDGAIGGGDSVVVVVKNVVGK